MLRVRKQNHMINDAKIVVLSDHLIAFCVKLDSLRKFGRRSTIYWQDIGNLHNKN